MNSLRKKSWGQHKKKLLDKIIEYFRFVTISKYIKKDSILLDLGCGHNGDLLTCYKKIIAKGVGVDVSVNNIRDEKISLITGDLNSKIDLPSNSFDVITLLAVVEHLELPEHAIKEASRLLKDGGLLIITTPNIKWKWLLELLANFKIISHDEIDDHKRYYSSKSLVTTMVKQGFNRKNIITSTYPIDNFIDFVVVAVAQK